MDLPIYIDNGATFPIVINITAGSIFVSPPWGETQSAGNGVVTNFVTNDTFQLGTTLVYVSGVYQGPGVDYTEAANGQSITFSIPVPNPFPVDIRYVKAS